MSKWLLIIVIISSCTATKPAGDKEVIHLFDQESYDPDGHIISYTWRQISGAYVHIVNPQAATTLGYFTKKGTFRFELTVKDNAGAISKDTATVIKH